MIALRARNRSRWAPVRFDVGRDPDDPRVLLNMSIPGKRGADLSFSLDAEGARWLASQLEREATALED